MSMFLTQSCTEDDVPGGGGGTEGAPFVELLTGTDLVDFSATVEPGASFTVRLDATPDAALLRDLEIFRDGFQADAANITIDAISVVNNPQLITGDDKNGITWNITTVAPSDEGVYTYEYDVTDDNNNTSSASVTITIETGSGGGGTVAPSVELIGSGTFEAEAGSLVSIGMDIQPGDSNLKEIKVLENGFTMTDLSRLYYKDVMRNFDSNPQPVDADDEMGVFPLQILIRTTSGSNSYSIEVTDVSDLSTSIDFTINETTTATPLDAEYTAILVSNADGPNNGGLDLDNGAAVSSSSAMAEVVDQGIDLAQPVASNWIQKIAPANGSVLKFVDLSTTELGSFANVTSKEDILTAWDAGTDQGGESALVLIGDTFVVNNGGSYYIMTVTDVVATTADNEDYYQFDVKR